MTSSTPPDDADPAAANPAAPGTAPMNPPVDGPAALRPAENAGACRTDQEPDQGCIDRYLWSLYTRTPKLDTVKVAEQSKVTVKQKGKSKTVTRTATRLVGEDFAWKDPKAAGLAGMSPMDYVIGGMDPGFRVTLYRALRALDDAGFKPGIMCAFRDDYRQSIATGLKAQNDRSFHGGSFRGGYGHGMAADIVSVKGDTRTERLASTALMWDYINAHEKELGIGRPYLDRDPPHVGPLDGQEYADHRLRPKLQHAEAAARKAATKLEARKSEARKSEARKSEAKKSEAKKPEAKKPEARKLEAKKLGSKKLEARKLGARKSEIRKSEIKKPEIKRGPDRSLSQDRSQDRPRPITAHNDQAAPKRLAAGRASRTPPRPRTPAI
jgi:hypothetical protein